MIRLWERPAFALTGNVTLHSFSDLLFCFRDVFTREATDFNMWGKKLLHIQNAIWTEPPKWITLNLLGSGSDRTTLLLRSDNLYLVGFNTSSGVWYAFQGYKHLIPGSIELPYSADYSSLLGLRYGGGKYMLPHLALGEEYYLDSLSALSNPYTNYRLNLGIALAKIIVMTIEAARFVEIGDLVDSHWTTEEAGHLSDNLAKSTVSWGDISHLLLCYRDGFPWAGTTAEDLNLLGIGNNDDALEKLSIILYVVRYNPDNPNNCIGI